MRLNPLFWIVITRVRRYIQSLFGWITLGPRAIVLNEQRQVLLVKHTYEPHWYLPGGGTKRGESVMAGLLRELKEEVGIIPTQTPQLLGIYFHRPWKIHNHPIIHIVTQYTTVDAKSPEIEKTGWFAYDALPEMTSAATRRRLDEYFQGLPTAEHW